MATIKAYTGIKQSRKLAEILPIESADMYYNLGESNIPNFIYGSHSDFICYTMCWSLAALVSILPRIEGFKPVLDLEINYIQYPSDIDLSTTADNPVDACVEMILKLHELKLI